MDLSAEFWMARGGTHIAAELVSLRFSWFHGSMQSSYYFHLHAATTPSRKPYLNPTLSPSSFILTRSWSLCAQLEDSGPTPLRPLSKDCSCGGRRLQLEHLITHGRRDQAMIR